MEGTRLACVRREQERNGLDSDPCDVRRMATVKLDAGDAADDRDSIVFVDAQR